MCQILNMSHSFNGGLVVEVSSDKDLLNCFLELYLFDFGKGEYNSEPNIKQAIGTIHLSLDSGIYKFKYELPSNCKVKCRITNGDEVLVTKERFIGDRYKISIAVESSEIGYLYKIKSDISISKRLIFYKSPVSSTRIHLPDNLEAGSSLFFTIKNKNFRPKFECVPHLNDCFYFDM